MATKFDSKQTILLQPNQKVQGNLFQKMMMSKHMQQAILLLQLPLLELEPFIEEQVVQNPLLEIENHSDEISEENEEEINEHLDEAEKELMISDQDLSILLKLDEDWKDHFNQTEGPIPTRTIEDENLQTYLEQSFSGESSLYKQLIHEAHETFNNLNDLKIAEILIGYIDQSGFLKTNLDEICDFHELKKEDIVNVLSKIQTFEPYGVGAATTQESLLIQLRCLNKESSLAYQIIQEHYKDLLHNQIPIIQKHFKCSYQDIQNAVEKDIAKLDLHPGDHFSCRPSRTLVPDVTLRQEDATLIVDVERDHTSSLRINQGYLKMLEDPSTPIETKRFIKHHLCSARWLMRNLQQRYSTIERIAQCLSVRQYQFFTKPEGKLAPLTMQSIADELHLHESTIARVVSNKYLFSPRGLFPLRYFFTNKYTGEDGKELSSSTVKEVILDLINHENKNAPLSDQEISKALLKTGIHCARRTIAKYRSILKIGNAQQRRKFFENNL